MRPFTKVVRVSAREFNHRRSPFTKCLKAGIFGKVIITHHGRDTYQLALLPQAKELIKAGWRPGNLGDCFVVKQNAS